MLNTTNDLFRSELVDRRDRLERALDRNRSDARLSGLLSEVDAALERIETGAYGLCETCHEPIEQDRLLADPLLRYCLDHLTPGEQRALEQDLQLAREIQRGLLPKRDLKIDGWEASHHFAPLGAVSGDYCDVVLPDGTGEDVHFLLGDVSGKGVAASSLMSNLHATFRTLLAGRMPIDALMQRANRLFCETTIPGQYATLVCVKASPRGEVELVNAGHCPVLIRHGGRTHVMQSGGLPLGMFCSSAYSIERSTLDPGDVMLLYTDGVIEARNRSDAEYGQERLLAMFDAFEEDVRRDSRRMTDRCLAHLTEFLGGRAPHDDVTVMAIRRV